MTGTKWVEFGVGEDHPHPNLPPSRGKGEEGSRLRGPDKISPCTCNCGVG